ncbi:MAG TPA: carbon-nitrogen hydrolase family protein [Dehalococcoidia bacterium]|nr:carbon-nitrogen hydrolase family protein [Dehalococcoidia bacterium]
MAETVRVASVQATPVFLNREATVEKACSLIVAAGRNSARLVVLPEAFVPSFPVWTGLPHGAAGSHRDLYAELLAEAVDVPGPTTRILGEAAREAGAYVVIGVNERNSEASGGTMYNTLLYFDDQGQLLGKHRKLVPTALERTVWGQGDGSTLEVFDTALGKLSGLTCWENYMPLARFTLYAAGTQIYVAPTWASSDVWLKTLQHIAFEGSCYVIGCCQPVRPADIPDHYAFKRAIPESMAEWINVGNSAIVSPLGFLAGPSACQEETLYADLDLPFLARGKAGLDTAGHYARPDVFQLTVNRSPRPMLRNVWDQTDQPSAK